MVLSIEFCNIFRNYSILCIIRVLNKLLGRQEYSMILYFLLSIVIFLIIIEVITVLFKLTGLSEEKARFQVISLLTGSGFTTRESELITQHPSRRRLAQLLMITGYVGFLTGISFLVDIIRKSLSFEK